MITPSYPPNSEKRQTYSPRLVAVEACPVCRSKRVVALMSVEDRRYGIPGKFKYDRCEACHTVFQGPVIAQEDIERCYPDAYYTHVPNPQLNEGPSGQHSTDRSFSFARNNLRSYVAAAVQGSSSRGALRFIAGAFAKIRRM